VSFASEEELAGFRNPDAAQIQDGVLEPTYYVPDNPSNNEVEDHDSEEEVQDSMACNTCLKYGRFKGARRQDVDDWLSEFKSTAFANQEDLEAKIRLFQGL
jgi:hypothetical protein